jgi:hypothetical protein
VGAQAVLRGYLSRRRRARRRRTTLVLSLYDGVDGARVARFRVRVSRRGISRRQLRSLKSKLDASLTRLSMRSEDRRPPAKAPAPAQTRREKQDRRVLEPSAQPIARAGQPAIAARETPPNWHETLDRKGQVIDPELPW